LWLRGWKLARCYARKALTDYVNEDDVQDAALLALEQFANSAVAGKFPKLDNRKDFFKLLATISARVAKNIRRKRAALKRGGGTSFESSDVLDQVDNPSAAEDIVHFEEADEMAAFFEFLSGVGEDKDLFAIAELIYTGRVEPNDTQAIKSLMGISRAGVYRKLRKLAARWAEFEARMSSGERVRVRNTEQ
jgi:hypothetical protein